VPVPLPPASFRPLHHFPVAGHPRTDLQLLAKSRTTTCCLCHPLQNPSSFARRLAAVASCSPGLNPTHWLESGRFCPKQASTLLPHQLHAVHHLLPRQR
jgi:hypothetical protein